MMEAVALIMMIILKEDIILLLGRGKMTDSRCCMDAGQDTKTAAGRSR